jgi:hypothetical protein
LPKVTRQNLLTLSTSAKRNIGANLTTNSSAKLGRLPRFPRMSLIRKTWMTEGRLLGCTSSCHLCRIIKLTSFPFNDSLSPADSRIVYEPRKTDAQSTECQLGEVDNGSPIFSPRSFVRSAGCSPSSGRPSPAILPNIIMDSSPILECVASARVVFEIFMCLLRSASDLPLPLLPDMPPLVSPQCSRTSSNQAIASPSAASLAEAALQRSKLPSTVASYSWACHDSLIKSERPEFGE